MKSIRGRLLLTLVPGLALVLAAGGLAVYLTVRADLFDQFDAGLDDRAHTLAALVKREPEGLVFEMGDSPAALIEETYFELRTFDGQLLKRSSNLGSAGLAARQLPDGSVFIGDADIPNAARGRAIWMAFRPRIDQDDWEGHDVSEMQSELLVIAAALDSHPVDDALASLLTALVVVGTAAAAFASLLVLAGVRWGLAPLGRLTQQIGAVTGDARPVRLKDSDAPRELLPVYQELNEMLGRVEHTLERERLFIDAAAHELRTPLAELRTIADVAMKWPDGAAAIKALREAAAVGRDMERFVESLLLISRGHADMVVSRTPSKALREVIHECLNRQSDCVSDKRLDVDVQFGAESDGPASAACTGAVEIIVRNLIDNALQYTPVGGRVSIRTLATANGQPWFVVENGPVKIIDADLPRLFEPLWRADASRSDRRHAGLGLAVVQHMAGVVGLRVDAALLGSQLQMRLSNAA